MYYRTMKREFDITREMQLLLILQQHILTSLADVESIGEVPIGCPVVGRSYEAVDVITGVCGNMGRLLSQINLFRLGEGLILPYVKKLNKDLKLGELYKMRELALSQILEKGQDIVLSYLANGGMEAIATEYRPLQRMIIRPTTGVLYVSCTEEIRQAVDGCGILNCRMRPPLGGIDGGAWVYRPPRPQGEWIDRPQRPLLS